MAPVLNPESAGIVPAPDVVVFCASEADEVMVDDVVGNAEEEEEEVV